MPTIDEKRVYGAKAGKRSALVACDAGVVAVDVSGDRVGGFGIDHRCAARDIERAGDAVAVATGADVLVGDYAPTAFGSAVAAGFDRRPVGTTTELHLVAAGPDGRIARRARTADAVPDAAGGGDESGESGGDGEGDAGRSDATGDADGWEPLGSVDGARAVSGGMVAAGDGVYRVGADGLDHAGLTDVRDVAADGVPLAATGGGLYRLGNGWLPVREGAFDAVAIAPDGRAHAAGPGEFVERRGGEDADWEPVDLPTDGYVVDVAHATGVTAALTDGGTLLLSAGDGWRARALGLSGAAGVIVH